MRATEHAYGRCDKCGYRGEVATEDFSFGHAFGIHHDICWICPKCESTDVDVTDYDLDIPDEEDR